MTRPGLLTGLATLVTASAVALLAAGAAGAWVAAAQPPGQVPASGRDLAGVWMPSHWYHLLGGGDPGNLPRNTLFSFPLPKAVAEREALLTPWGWERRKAWTPENDPARGACRRVPCAPISRRTRSSSWPRLVG